ncbi:MAG: DUF4351 domain-containing protein [Cyanobacteria bacterium RI_101]|nr:DUF4351 domain-containing protein [Cyanobacteria bacterium RI_101]
MTNAPDDYDSPWKTALVRYFPEFLAFYFPAAYESINWTSPHTFLEQELAQIVADAELGRRRVDCLVEVTLTTARQEWVYIHVEIQGRRDKTFAERLFIYNYRLYDRYHRPVATLAVLADTNPRWRPQGFSYDLLGSRTSIEFAAVKILDYANQLDALLDNPNPFALVTAAHLLTQQTRRNPAGRYDAKWRLARLLYERDWDKQRILDLFGIIDWLMKLPQNLDKQLWTSIQNLERNKAMPYVLSVERIARQEGRQEGLQEGRQKGLQEGRQEGLQEGRQKGLLEGESLLIVRLLSKRFGALSPEMVARIRGLTVSQLEQLGEALLDFQSLADLDNCLDSL